MEINANNKFLNGEGKAVWIKISGYFLLSLRHKKNSEKKEQKDVVSANAL